MHNQNSNYGNQLIIAPEVTAHRAGDGRLVLTQKFLDGVTEYAKWWPGSILVLVDVRDTPDSNLDHVVVTDSLPFRVQPRPTDESTYLRELQQAALVLGGPLSSNLTNQVIRTEYSLNTRMRIILEQTANPIRQAKRIAWTTAHEIVVRRAVRRVTGVQCNGTPTFNAYKHLNVNSMLYFDNRIASDMLISEIDLQSRLHQMRRNSGLRLAFSGRLIAMKGAHYLPEVCAELRTLGIPFTMDIYGGGELEALMAGRLRELRLTDVVRLRGVLDFAAELVPAMSTRHDVFVCCHPQGDPSCTYIETMACGVPIVGYANEAWDDLRQLSKAGWSTPMNRPKLVARMVAELHRNRDLVEDASYAARAFASQNLFEPTMRHRVEHMIECAERARHNRD